MSRTDTIADALTMIRNASRVGKESVDVPNSKMIKAIVEILKKEGYIKDFRFMTDTKLKSLRTYLEYDINKKPAILGIKRISKSGLRKYVSKEELPRVLRGYGIAILSTSKGIMTNIQAASIKVGGEVLCYIW